MEKVMALPEFKEEKQARTLSALLDFHQVKALYNFANLHPEEALKHNEQFLALLDKNPQMRQLHADRYFSVLNNFLIDCLVLKNIRYWKKACRNCVVYQKFRPLNDWQTLKPMCPD